MINSKQDKLEKKYLLVYCGYEGYESMKGFYTLKEVTSLVRKMKENCDKLDEFVFGYIPKNDPSDELGPLHANPKQLCIMTDDSERKIVCVCDELPDDLRNKETWWIG